MPVGNIAKGGHIVLARANLYLAENAPAMMLDDYVMLMLDSYGYFWEFFVNLDDLMHHGVTKSLFS